MARTPVAEGAKVNVVKVKARGVVTVGEDSSMWLGLPGVMGDIAGYIVRVKPPESASPEKIAEVKKRLEGWGAAAVRVMPQRRSAVVPSSVEFQAVRRPREVVMEMGGQANVDDRAALMEVLEDALGAAGL